MRSVRVAQTFDSTVHEAETCWYDTRRWPAWVDGLERVVEVSETWPNLGATVSWRSGPAGRGDVVERVVEFEPLQRHTVQVHDDSIEGRQSVAFTPVPDGVEVALELRYEIMRRSPLTPLVDVLFIRRAMATSLQATLTRFGVELTAARRPGAR
jgi:Polyketide cyclase / dehydrase and lipid transport